MIFFGITFWKGQGGERERELKMLGAKFLKKCIGKDIFFFLSLDTTSFLVWGLVVGWSRVYPMLYYNRCVGAGSGYALCTPCCTLSGV